MKQLRVVLSTSLAMVLAFLAFGVHSGPLQAMNEPSNEVATDVFHPLPGVGPTTKPTPTPQTGSEGGILSDAIQRLEQLDSYRSLLHLEWDGTDAEGQPTKGYLDFKEALVREPYAYQLNIEGEGFMEEEGGVSHFAMIIVGDQGWYYLSDSDTWMQVPADNIAGEAGTMSAKQMLQQFELTDVEAEPTTEAINEVECYRYSFTESEVSISEIEGKIVNARGDAFIAVEDGFLVKLWMQADITGAGEGALVEKGSMEFTYEVSDVNQEISIEPPVEAGKTGTREDIPVLPDAKMDFSSPDFIGYHTAKSVSEAGKFYEREMPKNGWQAEPGNSIQEDSATLNYTKGSDSAWVVITTDDQGTNVSILITAGEETETPEAKATLEAEETPEPEETIEAQLRADIPMLPDAKVDFSAEGLISYRTAKSIEDAAAFYEKEMPKYGWKGDSGNSATAEGAFLMYSKEEETAFVMISTDEQGTNVVISYGAGEEATEEPTEEAVEEPTEQPTLERQARDDIPMLSDAKLDPESTESMIIYRTPRQPREVGRFYEREMPKYDWEPAEDNDVSSGYLEFNKGAEMASVYFAAEGKGTLVEIYITSE